MPPVYAPPGRVGRNNPKGALKDFPLTGVSLCGFAIRRNEGQPSGLPQGEEVKGEVMTEKATDRLVRLQQRKVALERQIAKAEQDAREIQRKQDTRRKIIVGGAVLSAMADSPGLRAMVKTVLAQRVTRAHDRAAVSDLLDD